MKTILIDIDSLRPDHIGSYGYFKDITPEIDSVAEDSLLFENAYAAASPSLPSRAVMFSGRYPEHNQVVTHGPGGQTMNSPYVWSYEKKKDWTGDLSNWWNLPELLFHNSIETAAVSSFGRYPVPWMYRTWDKYIQPDSAIKNGTHATIDGKEVREKGINWLKENKDQEFFLYLQFWDPHVPCMREEEEIQKIDEKLPQYLQNPDFNASGYRSASQKDIGEIGDLKEMVQKYDAEIRHVDKQIGKIIEFLKENDLYEEVNIVITSDHGEEFGENGVFREHWSSYRGTQKIPLIIKTANNNHEKISHKVSNIDLAPTIADMHDVNKPEKWQGKSLLKRRQNSSWSEVLLTMHGLYSVQRAVIGNKYKYVETLHSGIRPQLPERQLFDIERDEYEKENIIEENEDLAEDFSRIMDELIEERKYKEDSVQNISEEGPYGWKWNS